MFEALVDPEVPAGAALTVDRLRVWLAALAGVDLGVDHGLDDADRVEQIGLLEQLKGAAAAAQAVLTVELVASQRAEQQAAGVPASRLGQGVAAQVGLARRESPHRGSQHVGLAQALTTELPATMAALRAGETSEWRATIVARETACLQPSDRRAADAELGPRLGTPGGP